MTTTTMRMRRMRMRWSLPLLLCVSTATSGAGLPRDEVLSWVKLTVLQGLGVEGAPEVRAPDRERRHLGRRLLGAGAGEGAGPGEGAAPGSAEERPEAMQVILFASSGRSCSPSAPGHSSSAPFTFSFHPSVDPRSSLVTSAQLWFYSGPGLPPNSSAPVSMLTPGGLLLAAADPARRSLDGWSTYHFNRHALKPIGGGGFSLRIDCFECRCNDDVDKLPFLNLKVEQRAPRRRPRSVSMTWSPSAPDLLQRPSQETHGDCGRAHVEISFEELGWDNWIVHPKTLTFYYCQGNCSSAERAAARMGMVQCCAPVPGSMRSVRVTTTSDGGYSFKYETLPDVMPEECACM